MHRTRAPEHDSETVPSPISTVFSLFFSRTLLEVNGIWHSISIVDFKKLYMFKSSNVLVQFTFINSAHVQKKQLRERQIFSVLCFSLFSFIKMWSKCMAKVCRACLKEPKTLFDFNTKVFLDQTNDNKASVTVSECFAECTSIKDVDFETSDNDSKVCSECFKQLEDSLRFKRKCIKSSESLSEKYRNFLEELKNRKSFNINKNKLPILVAINSSARRCGTGNYSQSREA